MNKTKETIALLNHVKTPSGGPLFVADPTLEACPMVANALDAYFAANPDVTPGLAKQVMATVLNIPVVGQVWDVALLSMKTVPQIIVDTHPLIAAIAALLTTLQAACPTMQLTGLIAALNQCATATPGTGPCGGLFANLLKSCNLGQGGLLQCITSLLPLLGCAVAGDGTNVGACSCFQNCCKPAPAPTPPNPTPTNQ
jgi:hypothetical protein